MLEEPEVGSGVWPLYNPKYESTNEEPGKIASVMSNT